MQQGPTGARGPTGAQGPAGPNYLSGGSGSPVAASTTVFTGFDSQSGIESNVWKILGAPVTFGHFYCAAAPPTGSDTVFTVRITTFSGGTSSTTSAATTCTVTAGNASGSATGTITLSAGQAIDIQVANGIAAGAVSWGLGP